MTISGTPTIAGTFAYTVYATVGNCSDSAKGTITVNSIPTVLTTACAALSGWSYNQAIIIDNTSNNTAQTDMQIMLKVNTQSIISAGHMRSDCGDIRFSDSDGCTPISSWIESNRNTNNTFIWVKVPSIPASSSYTIYMYYGSPGTGFDGVQAGEAPQVSTPYGQYDNGAGIFVSYESFGGLNSLPSQWTSVQNTCAGGTSINFYQQYMTVQSTCGCTEDGIYETNPPVTNPPTIVDIYGSMFIKFRCKWNGV